jgi:Zn finger protein HypA/HybF involved in hydrogenase expression
VYKNYCIVCGVEIPINRRHTLCRDCKSRNNQIKERARLKAKVLDQMRKGGMF